MAYKTIFEKAKDAAGGFPKSSDFYEGIVDKELGRLSKDFMITEDQYERGDVERQEVQNMVSVVPIEQHLMYFKYGAKTSQKLRFYDKNPMCFIVENQQNIFYGINLHYFSPGVRMGIVQTLAEGKFEGFTTGFHKYLKSEVKSPFLDLAMQEWQTSVLLPIEKFVRNIGGYEMSIDPRSVW